MSLQKHHKRNEIWLVSKGSCEVNSAISPEKKVKTTKLQKFDYHIVPLGQWHQICNPFSKAVHIIEIQYGEECLEEDIERFSNNN